MRDLLAEKLKKELETTTRRHFMKECISGMGGLALGGLFFSCEKPGVARLKLSERDLNPLSTLAPHYGPKVESVIYLHMAGAPSQLEMFDYKPELVKLHNQECPESLLQGRKFAFIRGRPKLLGPQANFEQSGKSGAWVSDYMPR